MSLAISDACVLYLLTIVGSNQTTLGEEKPIQKGT